MTAISITPGYPTFADTDGSPLNDGYVYIGLENQNPITAPAGAFWDKEFQVPANQPLRTSGGYIVRNGTPAAVYTGASYSILVQNKNLVTVYNAPSAVITNVTNNVEEITQYQGAHAVDPIVRNDGTPLEVGDLYFNTVINELKVWTGTEWVPASPGAITVQNFTGTGAQTGFNLATAPVAENNTQIYIDGVYQQKDTYTVAGATINFSTAPPYLSGIEVVTFSIASLGTVDASNVSYNEGSLGAVNTTVQAKLQESVSVKDFGAVGDGVTDDTAAIQAALDYFKNKSSTISVSLYIPGGSYLTTSELTLDFTSNSTFKKTITCDGEIVGQGLGVSENALSITANNCYVYQFYIRGLVVKNPGTGGSAIYFNGGDQTVGGIYQLELHSLWGSGGSVGSGITFQNAVFELSMYGCKVTNLSTSLYGFYFKHPDATATISSVDMYSCTARGGKNGIYLQTSSHDVKITGGTVLFAEEDGIKIDGEILIAINGVHVENCGESASDMASSTFSGIRASGSTVNISNIRYANSAKMKYAVRSFVTNSGVINNINGFDTTALLKSTRLSNSASANWIVLCDKDITRHDVTDSPQVVFLDGNRLACVGSDDFTFSQGGVDSFLLRAGGIRPTTDKGQYLGNSGAQWSRVSAGYLEINDGETAPTVLAGFARIYVDVADGDLKIKFGDGVIKTIVTDV